MADVTSPIITDDTGQEIKSAINALAGAISPAASNVTFNNTGTGMSASNAQAAIEELNTVTTGTTGTGGFALRKYGHITEIKGNGVVCNALGTAPSGFRPVSTTYIPVVVKTSGGLFYNGYLEIFNTGVINAYYMSGTGNSSNITNNSGYSIFACQHYVS